MFSVFCFCAFAEASFPHRVEVWEWVLKSRIFESCSRNGAFLNFLHFYIRLIRVG